MGMPATYRRKTLMNADLTHSFVFSPPDDAPDSWALTDPEDFSRRLADAFPETGTLPEKPWDKRESRWTLSFEVLIGDVWLEGMATTPWPGAGSFSVDNATPSEAAQLIHWFREQYVPVTASIVFTTGLGLENGVDEPKELPEAVDVETIALVLGDHAEAIETSLGS
jgi:hypothetical protein